MAKTLVDELNDIRTRLFDEESALLGVIAQSTQADIYGDKTRAIATRRAEIETLNKAIRYINGVDKMTKEIEFPNLSEAGKRKIADMIDSMSASAGPGTEVKQASK